MIGPEIPAQFLQSTKAGPSPDEEETNSDDEESSIGPKIPEGFSTGEDGESEGQHPQVGPQIPLELFQRQTKDKGQG